MRSGLVIGMLAVASTAVLAGCASTPAASTGSDDADDVTIVASTNVYGDVASRIAGDRAEVTSIIDSTAQDPHSYEATARDQLAVSRADVVIENGGGYDPFVDTLVEASAGDASAVLDVSELSGLIPEGADEHAHEEGDEHADADHEDGQHADEGGEHAHIEGFNEHVWYDFGAVDALARALADRLGEIDPDGAATYDDNYTAFSGELADLTDSAEAIAAEHAGEGVAVTEPVPLYLLEAAGLENRTPDDFSEAIEEGADVAPAALQRTLALFDDGAVSLLAYNEQTSGAETEQVRSAADDAGVAVVSFTETLPEGEDYLGWMSANIEAISSALD